MIRSWLSHGFDKTNKKATPKENALTEYELFLAKNEAEGVHLSFLSDEEIRGATVELSGNHSGVRYEMYYEAFVKVRDEYFPDPLIPYKDGVNIEKDAVLNFFIEFIADLSASAGESFFTVTAKDSSGCVISEHRIKLKVWDFALPETPSCETAVGIVCALMLKFHKVNNEEEKTQLYKSYYDELLKHKMSAFTLPYEITDPRADEYMSDSRVTTFTCDHEIGSYTRITDDEKLRKAYEKLSSNEVWRSKAYAYPVDEPYRLEHLEKLKSDSERLDTLIPGIPKISPFFRNIDVDDNTDQVAFMGRYVDIWCPKACLFETIYSESQKEKYPPLYDRMMQCKKEGSRIWWYVCNYPLRPYLNVLTDDAGLNSRALFWQQYRYEITGFLYWSVDCWLNLSDPRESTDTAGNDIHGDGILFYPGSKIGINGPVTSLRMKIIRDGIEDIDLLTLAEKELGRDFLLQKALSVAPSLTEVGVNCDGFSAVRAEIGNALEKALKSKSNKR